MLGKTTVYQAINYRYAFLNSSRLSMVSHYSERPIQCAYTSDEYRIQKLLKHCQFKIPVYKTTKMDESQIASSN